MVLQENNQSVTNIDNLWLRNIFDQMILIKETIALSRNGFKDIPEMISVPEAVLFEIQLRNLRLITTTFSSLLDDVHSQIGKDYYDETKKLLNTIRDGINSDNKIFFRVIPNQKTKINIRVPTNNFYRAVELIDLSRAKLVRELTNLLYLHETEKPSGLDKTKKGSLIR